MAVDWSADGMRKWREEAVKFQQQYFDLFGTPMWRQFEPSHYVNLKKEIGFALYGAPEKEPHEKLNDNTGYTDTKLKRINELLGIIEKCTKNNTNPNNICVNFLFVLGKKNGVCITDPVIRTQQYDRGMEQNINLFIDSYGRVYNSWQYYLEYNAMKNCVLCYPKNGVYTALEGPVDVEIGISPDGRRGTSFCDIQNIYGNNVIETRVYRCCLHRPIEEDPWQATFGGWMSPGCVATRLFFHHQLIRNFWTGLRAESQSCWFGIAGGAMSVLNSLVVANGLANIVDKFRNNEEITALDIFQFKSAVLFFTHSVISTHQAKSLINSMGKKSSGGFLDHIKAWKNLISGAYSIVPGVPVACTYLVSTFKKGNLLFFCYVVGRKLKECLLRGMHNCMLEVRELLNHFWESLSKEMAEVVYLICRAFGVKHWSELVITGSSCIESGHIRAMASTLIVEKKSLVEYGNRAMPSHQRQASSDNSAVVGTNDGPNNLVDGETQIYDSYYDEIAHILAKFVDQNMCRNPEDFRRYMVYVCKFVKSQLQEKESHYKKSWETVKLSNPDVKIEDFKKLYRISANPYDHFLQEVFNKFIKEEQDAFNLLQLTYERQNAGTSAQEKEHGEGFIDADGVNFYPFYSERGLASNGMLSEQQYREMAAKFTGQHADTDSIYISASGDTAVIEVNDAAEVITLQCWMEDGKVSGIAAVLHTASEQFWVLNFNRQQ